MTNTTNATETASRRYAVVYARGAAHIQGLDEKVTTGPDSLNYAYSACSALSKNKAFWCTSLVTDDLAAALAQAELIGRVGPAKGMCKNCAKTANAALEAQAAAAISEQAASTAEPAAADDESAKQVDIPMVAVFVKANHADAFYARMTEQGPAYRVRDVERVDTRTVRFVGEDRHPADTGYESYTWSMMECVGYFGSPPEGPVATLNGRACPRSY